MAITINVAGSYNDKDIKRAQRDLDALGRAASTNSQSFSQRFADMGDSMVAFGTTMTTHVTLPIVAAGAAMFAAFTGEEDAIARMEATLAATGGVAGVTADHIRDLASRLQDTTTFADDATIGAAALLLTFKNLRNEAGAGNDVFDRTIQASQDLSALMGTDLNSSVMMLGKALQDPADGLARLTRVGIQFTDEQQAQIRALAESGDMLGAQKLMLAEVESQFGGTAETMAGTSSGKIKQAINSLGDAAEGFGEIIARVIDKVSEFMKGVGDFFKGLSPEMKEMIVIGAAIAAAIGPVLIIVGKLMGAIVAIKAVFAGIAAAVSAPVLIVVAIIAALVAAVVVAWQRSEEFRDTVMRVWTDVRKAVVDAWEGFIKPAIDDLVAAFNNHIKPALVELGARFNEIWPGIRDAVLSFWGYVQPVLQFFVNVLTNVLIPALAFLMRMAVMVWTNIATIVAGAWTSIFQPVFSAIGGFIRNQLVPAFVWFGGVVSNIWSGVSGAISGAWGVINWVFGAISGGISSVAGFFVTAVDTIKGAFSTIGDAIATPFRSAFNLVIRAWNATLGNINFTLPSNPLLGPLSGFRVALPKLQEFNKGGMVPGIPGDPQLAIVHAGEMILRQTEIDEYRAKRGGGEKPSGDINVYVNRSDADPREIGRELLWSLRVAG